jgi:polygalacturonase
MPFDRRFFLTGSALSALQLGVGPALAASSPVFRPESFGARGDGQTDDTRALQACFDAAAGATVELRRGAVYRVDTNYNPTHAQFGGVQLKDGQTLRLNGAQLKALPSVHNQGSVIGAYEVHGWRIEGPGRITGERDIHRGEGGEWGMGIAAWAAQHWSIGSGVEIDNCWGDGLYVGYTNDGGNFCQNFVIDRVHIWDCRRCGMGIIAARNGEIRSPHIHHIGGTAPAAGIDLEADLREHWNRNITITGARIYDAHIGVDFSTSNEDIVLTGSDLSAYNSGIVIGRPVRRLHIFDNTVESTLGGLEGAALRTAVGEDSHAVTDVLIENNVFRGGGDFVLDIVGEGYRNFVIDRNRLQASNRGVQGVARLGSVTFTRNDCTVEAAAGKADQYFIYFTGSRHGENVYRNRSPFEMHSILSRDTDLGTDVYTGPNLRRIVEPR